VLFLLAVYGIAIAYIVIPVQKYLTQPISSSVTIRDASAANPIPFPGIQVCNFNWNLNLKSIHVYYIDPITQNYAELFPNVTHMNDYAYDVECYEINNHPSGNIQIASKRQALVVIAEVPVPQGVEVYNDECPNLCDPTLPANATILDINPDNDALGISLGFFQPNGTTVNGYAGSMYIGSGTYSQVYLTLLRTYHFDTPDTPEENYEATSSSIAFVPDAYAVNYSGIPVTFKMSEVVYVTIQFGNLAYQEVTEEKPYEAFNAFGDATAIVCFFTGFGIFGGPTFHGAVVDSSKHRLWSKFWYAD